MAFVESLLWVLFIALSGSVAYLYLIGVVGLIAHRRHDGPKDPCRLLILVPAHNEEIGLDDTLKRLIALEPVGRTDVVVIADNCTDHTAALAGKYEGVRVLERHDPDSRGKGYALQWAFSQLPLDEYDAVAIVDADTLVQPNMARQMAASLQRGYGAVQVSNELLVERPTPLSRLQRMANAVENRLFWAGRAALGLPVLLRGTGMAIRTDVLKQFPFTSHELAEDTDYSVNLLRNGVRIDFNAGSAVRSAAPSDYIQSYVQKDRWASGTLRVVKRSLWPLFREGLKSFQLGLGEMVVGFFLLSRPMMMYHIVAVMLLTFLAPRECWLTFWLWGAAMCGLLIVYLAAGVFLVHQRRATLRALLQAPYFGAWMFLIQLRAVLNGRRQEWVRTERMPRSPSAESDIPENRPH